MCYKRAPGAHTAIDRSQRCDKDGPSKGPSCPANSLVSGSLCAEPCCSTISTIWRRNHALVASVAALLTVALLTVALLTVPLLTEAALLRVTTVAALLTVAWVHSGRGGGAY